MNQIHSVAEFSPFEEYQQRPYLTCSRAEGCPAEATEVTDMAYIISFYAAILGLAIWQENHGRDETGESVKEC
jgi:hypothetical protein